MDDPDDEVVLHYTVDTQPALWDDEAGGYDDPFVFNNNFMATRFTVGPGVTEIGEGTFANRTRLSSLQGMGSGVTAIGERAFSHTGLVALLGMGENVEEIGAGAFNGCQDLTSLLGMPESVTSILSHAFNCSGLTSLRYLPSNLAAIGSVFAWCHGLTSLRGLSENISEIGNDCFWECSGITSLQGGEYVTMICGGAFWGCDALTTLQGLSRNVTAIGDPDDTASTVGAFQNCPSLVEIGPGFSPSCFLHPDTFDNCPALLAAAEAKGFSTAIEWGRHHWLAYSRRRFTVITAVRQVRRNPPSANHPSPLLSLLAGAPDDMVRVIVGFMGEGEVESAQEKEARWELTAFRQSREIGLQRERAELAEERVERQREEMKERVERLEEQMEQQREQTERRRELMEQQREQLEELLRRELEGRGADEGDRRVRQKREK